MMRHGIQPDSVQRSQRDEQGRLSAQTSPHVPEGSHHERKRLRRALQLDDRKMPAPGQVTNVEFQQLAFATANGRLRLGTRRPARPGPPRLESWLAGGRSSTVVDLVRRRTIESVVRSVAVVPVRKKRQLPAKGVALVGDQQSPRALALQRSNEAFDHRDTAVLADRTEALTNPAATAIHQQKGQRCGNEKGSQEVQKPSDVGTVVRSECQT